MKYVHKSLEPPFLIVPKWRQLNIHENMNYVKKYKNDLPYFQAKPAC